MPREPAIDCLPLEPKMLHVYHNGYNWIIAESVGDARQIALTMTIEDCDGDGWELWPDEKPISINDEGGFCPMAELEAMTAREWADRQGRGWLCSTEY